MKKNWQQLRQEVSQFKEGWRGIWWLHRWRQARHQVSARLARQKLAIRQFTKKTRWGVVFGTCVGIILAMLLGGLLLSYNTKPQSQLIEKLGNIASVRQQLQEGPIEEAAFTFGRKFGEQTNVLQEYDAEKISKMSVKKLLTLKEQVLAYVKYLIQLRGQRRDALIDKLPTQLDLASVRYNLESISYYDSTYHHQLDSLRIDSMLAELALPLVPVATMSGQELAQTRLNYLGQQAHQLLPAPVWQRELARLQLRDAQYASFTPPQLDSLRKAELALLRVVELRRGELTATSQRPAARLLDSCYQEIKQLQLLDSCRQELAYWFPKEFGLAYSQPARHIKLSVYTEKQKTSSITHPSVSFLNDMSPEEIFVIAIVLMLLTSPIVGSAGLLQLRRGLRTKPPGPASEIEPLVLQALLLAYADTIQEALLMPRKIKRFAGKVRLQYYLLEALSREQIRAESQFVFGPNEQVLAFLLLLLIEQRIQRLHAPFQDEANFRQQLRIAYKETLAAGKFEVPDSQYFICKQGVVTLYSQVSQSAKPESQVVVILAEALKTANAERLLKQLYWLNAGLLV